MRLPRHPTKTVLVAASVFLSCCIPGHGKDLMTSTSSLTDSCSVLNIYLDNDETPSEDDQRKNEMFVALVIANAHVNSQDANFSGGAMWAALQNECRAFPRKDMTTAAHDAAKRLNYSFFYIKRD